MFDPTYRPGDNLYTNSAISWDPDTGKMNWYFQFTPGDMWDYDEEGTHILIDGDVAGQPRKLITHSARNGSLYTMDRYNGQIIGAKPYMDVNWTKGIDQKTGKPIDYDPSKDIQTYAGVGNFNPGAPLKNVCPSMIGGNNYWPSSYSPNTKLHLHPGIDGLRERRDRPRNTTLKEAGMAACNRNDRFESNLTAVDPITQEIKKNTHLSYPNFSARWLLAADWSSSACLTAPWRPSTPPALMRRR